MPNEDQIQDIIGEIDPDKIKCDCCGLYKHEDVCKDASSYPYQMEYDEYLSLEGIFKICQTCHKISSKYFSGGAERLKQKLINDGAIESARDAERHAGETERKIQDALNAWFGG